LEAREHSNRAEPNVFPPVADFISPVCYPIRKLPE
jgi:hypothetical protein